MYIFIYVCIYTHTHTHTYAYTHAHHVQKKIKRVSHDMNILLGEKHIAGEQGYFKPESGMKLRGMIL